MNLEKKKIKVLNVITLFSVGGATETVVSMADGLIKKGYDVHIATGPNNPAEGSMYETTEKLGIPVYTFTNLKRAINVFNDLKIIYELTRFIKINKYDIVHTHSSKAGVVGRVASFLAGTPIRIHTIHGLPFHRYEPWYIKYSFMLIEKVTALISTKIVAVTHTIVNVMVKNHLAKKNKFVVIRSGFDVKEYTDFNHDVSYLKEKYNIANNDFVIGKVARFSILKGHIFLLEAFKIVSEKIPNAKLLLIGNGELENELKQKVNEMNLDDRVIFTGLIQPEEIPATISLLDVLVHTSLLEGLARVLPQAIMLAKPVISFDLDGAPEVIKDGYNGYLIEPENIEMLANRIINLALNPDKAKKFGIAGKEFLKDEFCSKKMVDEIDKLYKSMLK